MRTVDDQLNAEERYCYEAIRALTEAHHKAIKPYVDRLVYLHSISPQVPFMITLEQAKLAGLVPRD